MLDDLWQHPASAAFACDIAIVGAGAAGITLARHLAAAGREVCLVESGGLDFDSATQALAAGPNLGAPYYDLVDARLRFFGGTTAIWGGRCSRFEPLDFAHRPWVAHSGWPLDAAVLEPYLARAARDFELGAASEAASGWLDDTATRLGFAPLAFRRRRGTLQREAGILNTACTFKMQRDAALGLSLRKCMYNHLKHELAAACKAYSGCAIRRPSGRSTQLSATIPSAAITTSGRRA